MAVNLRESFSLQRGYSRPLPDRSDEDGIQWRDWRLLLRAPTPFNSKCRLTIVLDDLRCPRPSGCRTDFSRLDLESVVDSALCGAPWLVGRDALDHSPCYDK